MTAARLINDRVKSDKCQRWACLMVTLTYKKFDDWEPDHITDFLRRVQAYARRKGQKLPYVWVMELQKRGAPHYHVVIWIPKNWYLPKADRRGWWEHGSTNVCRVKNAVGYVAKYASKLDQKEYGFPKGARIHGIGGVQDNEKRIIAWWKLPKFLRSGEEGSCVWRRAIGGGWICKYGNDAGMYIPSQYGLCSVAQNQDRTEGYVRLVPLPSMQGQRVPEDITQAWKEAEYEKARAWLSSQVCLLELDRVAWISAFERGVWGKTASLASPDKSIQEIQS